MKVIEQRYFKQFNALDSLLAQMNTAATSLDNWLAQTNKKD
jgi:flagellar capping protein FliD